MASCSTQCTQPLAAWPRRKQAFQFIVCGPCCKLFNCHGNVHQVSLVLVCVHVEGIQCMQGLSSGDVPLNVPQSCDACGVPCPGHRDFCGRAVLRSPCQTVMAEMYIGVQRSKQGCNNT